MKAFQIMLCLIAAVSGLLLTLYASVYFIAFDINFYEREYEKNDAYESVKMTKDDLRTVSLRMIDYLKENTPELNIETTVDGSERLFFSEKEIYHMNDVLILFKSGRILKNIALVMLIASVAALAALKHGSRRLYAKTLAIALSVFLALSLIFAGIAALNFERAFTIFHKLFFANDLWLLDPSVDLLIRILPLEFFIAIAAKIAAAFFGTAAFADAVSIWLSVRLRHSRSSLQKV